MEFMIPFAAAVAVGLFAKFQRNRSAIFWTLGTTAAVFVGEIPIRAVLAGQGHTDFAKTATVTLIVCGLALLLAIGSSRKPKPAITTPGDGHSAPTR